MSPRHPGTLANRSTQRPLLQPTSQPPSFTSCAIQSWLEVQASMTYELRYKYLPLVQPLDLAHRQTVDISPAMLCSIIQRYGSSNPTRPPSKTMGQFSSKPQRTNFEGMFSCRVRCLFGCRRSTGPSPSLLKRQLRPSRVTSHFVVRSTRCDGSVFLCSLCRKAVCMRLNTGAKQNNGI